MPLISKAFSDLITFSRTGSTATYFAANGVLTAAAADVPRFDYDPATFLPRGLLIEEQRTNSIRNNTMQGAVAGTPGTLPTNWIVVSASGLTTNVIGTGTEAGVNYVDIQFVGTPTATVYTLFFDATSQIAALNAQTWSSSLWCKIVAGTITNITSVNNNITYRDSGGASLQSARTAMSLTSTWTRYAQAGTATNASTAFVQTGLWLTITVGAAIDITLRIGLPQLELGAFATSVIPTTTMALTRNADTANINTMSPWYNQVNGSVYAEFVSITDGSATQTNASQGVWSTTQSALGSFNGYGNAVNLTTNSTAKLVGRARYDPTLKNNIVQIGSTTGFIASNTIYKTAVAWDASNIVADSNIGALNSTANTAAVDMGTHNRMTLGSQNVGGAPPYQLNGWLRKITFYPTKLSDANLGTLTT